jgi:hypothetical protein
MTAEWPVAKLAPTPVEDVRESVIGALYPELLPGDLEEWIREEVPDIDFVFIASPTHIVCAHKGKWFTIDFTLRSRINRLEK